MRKGRSALPEASVRVTMSPSAFMSEMPCTMPNAPDCAFSSVWRRSVATTSSAVTGAPSWKVTPARILNFHSVASALALISSAMR